MIYCIFKDDYENFMPTNETIVNKIHLEKLGVKCLKRSEFYQNEIDKITKEDHVINWVGFDSEEQMDLFNSIPAKKYLKNIDTCSSKRIPFEKDRKALDKIKFDAILLTYCTEENINLLKSWGHNVISYPHLLDYSQVYSSAKQIDVLISGQMSHKSYPTRTRIAEVLLNNMNIHGLNVQFLPHPGYEVDNLRHGYIGEEFIKLLSVSKLSVTCTGDDDSLVMKYLEIGKAGSLPLGDYPSNTPEIAANSMIAISKEDTNEKIIEKVKNAIENNALLLEKTKNYQRSIAENYDINLVLPEIINKIIEGKYE